MKKIFEFIVRSLMQQKLLLKIEKDVEEGETHVCDLYMEKDVEYSVRGKSSNKRDVFRLSLKSTEGVTIPTFTCAKGFDLISEEDGLCQVWVTIRDSGKKSQGRLVVTVCRRYPVPSTSLDWAVEMPHGACLDEPVGNVARWWPRPEPDSAETHGWSTGDVTCHVARKIQARS